MIVMLVCLKTMAVIHRCYQRFRGRPLSRDGSQPSLPLRAVAGTGLLAHTVVHSIGLSSRIADRSVRQKASGYFIPTRCYREVFVTFSLAGSGGSRSYNSPVRSQRSLHMLYGWLSLRKYLSFDSEAQQARLTPRV
jgi:hypothetical protein